MNEPQPFAITDPLPTVAGNGFHQYAFTNEVVANGYTMKALTGDADSGVSSKKKISYSNPA